MPGGEKWIVGTKAQIPQFNHPGVNDFDIDIVDGEKPRNEGLGILRPHQPSVLKYRSIAHIHVLEREGGQRRIMSERRNVSST